MKSNDRIVVVHWEGPYPWADCRTIHEPGHVLYALHGSHHLYGRDVLLYIGRSDAGVGDRLQDHEQWVADEYDLMTVRLASIGDFTSWSDSALGERYAQAEPGLVAGVEALLIHAHQPAYNTMNKASLERARDLRIMNTGRLGHLLPEVSYLYHGAE